LTWWNHIPEHIKPTLFTIGSFQLRYYGLMYIVAFTIVYYLVLYRVRTEKPGYSKDTINSYFIWAILGVILGGRLGYILFYNFKYFIANPLGIIVPFDFSNGFRFTGISGMSYHGGVIGVILFSSLFCNKHKVNFWHLADLLCPAIPLGYTFGRLGNFINGELYGRVTDVQWGMYFPLDPTHQLRHPSQLYEAIFEGIFLFILLWSLRKIKVFDGFFLSLYLIGYGFVRFFIEFVRQPDSQLGFILGPLTMGQILCIIMVSGGIFIMIIKASHNSRSL